MGWLFEWLSFRWPLWRKITDLRLASQQADLLRIEAKVDDDHFRLHKTLGELAMRLDGQAFTAGGLAREVAGLAEDAAKERQHLDMTVRAGDLIADAVKQLRRRIEDLEKIAGEQQQNAREADERLSSQCERVIERVTRLETRADEADRQICYLLKWAEALEIAGGRS